MGPVGPQGPAGQAGLVNAAAGLKGDGSAGSPLRVDFSNVASKVEAGRLIEAEAIIASAVNTGAVVSDVSASGGAVRLAAYGSDSGTLWSVDRSTLGDALAVSRAQVLFRVKVASVASSSSLASFGCQVRRRGAGALEPAGFSVDLRPDRLAAADTWLEVAVECAFRPDDEEQVVLVNQFTTQITDLALDFVRIRPIPEAGAWQLVTFNSGWSEWTDSELGPVSYVKTADGVVRLRGLIHPVSGTGLLTSAFNLPPGLRPSRIRIFAVSAGLQFGEVRVYPNGDVVPYAGGVAGTWFALDSIHFTPD